jgi:hypothetical protein
MGGAASTQLSSSIGTANKNDTIIPLTEILKYLKVFLHNTNGEVLVLIDDHVENYVNDWKKNWSEANISTALQRSYIRNIKFSISIEEKQIERVHEKKNLDIKNSTEKRNFHHQHSTSMDSTIPSQQSLFNSVQLDLKADSKTGKSIPAASTISKQTTQQQPNYSNPNLYSADTRTDSYNNIKSISSVSLKQNNQNKDVIINSNNKRQQQQSIAQLHNDYDDKENKVYKNSREANVCPTCGLLFSSQKKHDIEFFDEHISSCALLQELKKKIFAVDDSLRPVFYSLFLLYCFYVYYYLFNYIIIYITITHIFILLIYYCLDGSRITPIEHEKS